MAGGKVLSVEAASLEVQFGEADAAALVALDVTERTRLQERLLLSDRMASLGTLTAGVAHEINNPLSVVMANLDFVREHAEPGGRGRTRKSPPRWSRRSTRPTGSAASSRT